MSQRTKRFGVSIALGLLLVIVGIGVRRQLTPAGPTLVPAVVQREVQPYSVITSDMIVPGAPISLAEARRRGIWSVDEAVGKMTIDLVQPGTLLAETNVLKIESMGGGRNPELEIISFYTTVDPRLPERIRQGHLVNLYGFGVDEVGKPFMTLIAERLWVVAMAVAGGTDSDATLPTTAMAHPTVVDPILAPEVITLAVTRGTDSAIIDALKARGLIPWVTLAANQGMPIPSPIDSSRIPLVGADGRPITSPTP